MQLDPILKLEIEDSRVLAMAWGSHEIIAGGCMNGMRSLPEQCVPVLTRRQGTLRSGKWGMLSAREWQQVRSRVSNELTRKCDRSSTSLLVKVRFARSGSFALLRSARRGTARWIPIWIQ